MDHMSMCQVNKKEINIKLQKHKFLLTDISTNVQKLVYFSINNLCARDAATKIT